VKGTREPETFVVPFGTEPQVFTAMATLLTAAYMAKMIITVTYLPQVNELPVAVNVKLGEPFAGASPGRIGFNRNETARQSCAWQSLSARAEGSRISAGWLASF
jgi:hypothetical protein